MLQILALAVSMCYIYTQTYIQVTVCVCLHYLIVILHGTCIVDTILFMCTICAYDLYANLPKFNISAIFLYSFFCLNILI